MRNVLTMLDAMRRPRLLIQAARIGATEYRREDCLLRVLGGQVLPRSAEALLILMDIEAELNLQRTVGDAAYLASRHVEVLIAMMGEARILRTAHA